MANINIRQVQLIRITYRRCSLSRPHQQLLRRRTWRWLGLSVTLDHTTIVPVKFINHGQANLRRDSFKILILLILYLRYDGWVTKRCWIISPISTFRGSPRSRCTPRRPCLLLPSTPAYVGNAFGIHAKIPTKY